MKKDKNYATSGYVQTLPTSSDNIRITGSGSGSSDSFSYVSGYPNGSISYLEGYSLGNLNSNFHCCDCLGFCFHISGPWLCQLHQYNRSGGGAGVSGYIPSQPIAYPIYIYPTLDTAKLLKEIKELKQLVKQLSLKKKGQKR